MKQRGLFSLPLMAAAVAAAIIGIMGIALKVQSGRLANAKAETEQVRSQFAGFKAEVERLGKEAKAKVEAERIKQAEESKRVVTNYEKRLVSINDAYRRLRDQRSDPGTSPMPVIPDTARPVDDTARDQRLLEVLRIADLQTARLEALQEWVRMQTSAR